ncbi:MAG: glutathione S-transferase family protein, partial [Geminicoccaceae bacterium]
MGMLIDGTWQANGKDARTADGRFVRQETRFRNWITPDGAPGPTGEGGFEAVAGRYHLYVSLACPWAHRTLIFRRLEGLEDAIGVSVVHWHMGEHGWTFEKAPGATGDRLYGARHLYEIYARARPDYTGRVSVPVLWDKERETIVSNESSEIIRMLNSAFDEVGAKGPDFYPEPLRAEIDRINAKVYDNLNNGVYKSGFATTQEAYEEAVATLFETLDELE